MVNGNVGFGKDEMCSYKHTHNGAVHIALGGLAKNENDVGATTRKIVNEIVREVNSADPNWDFSARAFAADLLDDVKEQVIQFIKDNYNNDGEKIVLYGYSWGAETVTEIAEDLKNHPDFKGVKIELLVTVDAAKGIFSSTADRTVSDNVKKNENFYQTTPSSIGSKGGANKAENPEKTVVKNYNKTKEDPKTTHANIDEKVFKDVLNLVREAFGLNLKND